MTKPRTATTTWPEMEALIEADHNLWVRAAAIQHDDGWNVYLLDLVAGGQPVWDPLSWHYPRAVFAAFPAYASDVLAWFRDGKMKLGDITADLPPSSGYSTFRWNQRSSAEQPWFEPLGWPSYEVTLPARHDIQEPHGPMISAASPSFITFSTAAAAFFGMGHHSPGGARTTSKLMYRFGDRTARFVGLRIAEDFLEATIEQGTTGRHVPGTELRLELAADEPGPTPEVLDPDQSELTVRIELPTGLPEGAWVLIKSGIDWVDRRFLAYPYARGNEQDVEWIIPAQARLEGFLASRERHNAEFKSAVPTGPESKLRMMKTAAAFANGNGGSILIGVTDDREVVGIDRARLQRAIDAVSEMLGRWVTPPPPHRIEELLIEGSDRVVLEVIIDASTHIHGAGQPAETPTVYVRPFSTTEKAWPSEIEDIVRQRHGGEGPPWLSQL
ncbi:MAG TPA: ATP-binding protein [Acidimicrobiales bacterium]|nr:ATP-binding protein [Acidimicrobiales bacterium]